MKKERQIRMVKDVAKSIKRTERASRSIDSEYAKMHKILNGIPLDEINKDSLSKKDLEFLQWFVANIMKQTLNFYPNLA